MLLKKTAIYILIVVFFGMFESKAQESSNASGGDALGNGGSVSYSIGQIVYHTNSGTNSISIAEGIQQPYEISIVTSIETVTNIDLKLLVYPNPTSDFLRLIIDKNQSDGLFYQLYDLNSKLLIDKKINSSKTNIEMAHLANAIYFLSVFQGNQKIKTFKIIKN